jgi:hypothetical protein
MAQSATRRAETLVHPSRISTSDEKEIKRKPPGSEKELLKDLIRDVVDAGTLKNEASEAFNEAIDHFPSGLPYPDGAQRIKNTSAQLATARKQLMTAHERLDDFLNQNRARRLRRFASSGGV